MGSVVLLQLTINCCIVKMAGPNVSTISMAIEEAGGKQISVYRIYAVCCCLW